MTATIARGLSSSKTVWPASARTGSPGISSIPALMVSRDRVVLCAQPRGLPEAALAQLIAKARELDLGPVRAGIAERDACARPAGHNPVRGTGPGNKAARAVTPPLTAWDAPAPAASVPAHGNEE
jgi:hypothetical protein